MIDETKNNDYENNFFDTDGDVHDTSAISLRIQ